LRFIRRSGARHQVPRTHNGDRKKSLGENVMMKKLLMAAGIALASATAMVAPAQAAWIPIAERVVTDRIDVDDIVLPGPVHYRRLKICVYDHPVHFYDMDVFFANGGHQDVSLRSRLNAGECTRNIDLNGGARNITRIRLKYEETSWFVARAVVRVFGEL
jgi:hypothetical protein